MSLYLQWLFEFIFIEFWRGVASHVGAEAVQGAVVDLLHQPEHLQGDLHTQVWYSTVQYLQGDLMDREHPNIFSTELLRYRNVDTFGKSHGKIVEL